MVSLAEILNQASGTLYDNSSMHSLEEKAQSAKGLDDCLQRWRTEMSSIYQIDKLSLKEPESISKRKLVLKLSLSAYHCILEAVNKARIL